MKDDYNKFVLELLSAAIYDLPYDEKGQPWEKILKELQSQSVMLIPADKLKSMALNTHLRKSYMYFAAQQISFWNRIMFCQQEIVAALQNVSVPAAVLKGAAAAVYYPRPKYRSMGDIDLIVRPEDFDRAYEILKGMSDMKTDDEIDESSRHECFERKGIHIELHRYFSAGQENGKYSCLDALIFEGFDGIELKETEGYCVPILPPLQNGLVFLQHISQHLETGLGLRQILDWMLYARAELSDEIWQHSFAEKAEATGLKKLALVVTRMCQMYLGLTEKITWCANADEGLCRDLMEYIMHHGNFGRKDVVSSRTVSVLYSFKHPFVLLRRAQKSGCMNWEILKQWPFLRPFAWVYQLGRWSRKGMQRRSALKGLAGDIRKAARQDAFLDDLGVLRSKNQ